LLGLLITLLPQIAVWEPAGGSYALTLFWGLLAPAIVCSYLDPTGRPRPPRLLHLLAWTWVLWLGISILAAYRKGEGPHPASLQDAAMKAAGPLLLLWICRSSPSEEQRNLIWLIYASTGAVLLQEGTLLTDPGRAGKLPLSFFLLLVPLAAFNARREPSPVKSKTLWLATGFLILGAFHASLQAGSSDYPPENVYLRLIDENGYIGLGLFGLMIAHPWVRGLRNVSRSSLGTPAEPISCESLFLGTGVGMALLAGWREPSFFEPACALPFFLILGRLSSLRSQISLPPSVWHPSGRSHHPAVRATALAVALIVPAALGVRTALRIQTPADPDRQSPPARSPEGRIHLLLKQGRFSKALVLIDRWIKAEPADPVPWNLKGQLHLQRGETGLAEHCFRQAIQTAPSDWQGWLNLGGILLQQGEMESSLEALRKARALAPEAEEVEQMLNLWRIRNEGRDPK
jgi:hypothetical protein